MWSQVTNIRLRQGKDGTTRPDVQPAAPSSTLVELTHWTYHPHPRSDKPTMHRVHVADEGSCLTDARRKPGVGSRIVNNNHHQQNRHDAVLYGLPPTSEIQLLMGNGIRGLVAHEQPLGLYNGPFPSPMFASDHKQQQQQQIRTDTAQNLSSHQSTILPSAHPNQRIIMQLFKPSIVVLAVLFGVTSAAPQDPEPNTVIQGVSFAVLLLGKTMTLLSPLPNLNLRAVKGGDLIG